MNQPLIHSALPLRQPVTHLAAELPAEIILINQGDTISAWLNICPHQGRPLNYAPDKFLLTPEGHLMCAAHGATFDTQSGECINGPCKGATLTAVPIDTDAQGQLTFQSPFKKE